MIEFQHKLPCMKADGKRNGTYNNYELGFPGVLTTTDYRLGNFIYKLRSNIYADRRVVFIDGKFLVCNINWIRDHVHVMKASKHWEYRFNDFLDFIIETQREDGQFFELIKQYDDCHWKYVNEDCYKIYPNDNLALVRLEVEADIEYLVVEGAANYYHVTGDDEWLSRCLPKLEKAIDYVTSDEKRFDKEHGLVKRGFTIDTWDFAYGMPATNRRIEKDTPMSIMHGDNSGVYQAMNQLAWFNRRLGNESKAVEWEKRAEALRNNMFKYLWNGSFFIHQLHLNHKGADNLEKNRLSLSNTYDINRGVTDIDQSRKIIEEYIERGKTTKLFAEWFSIDPPYESFNGYEAGKYVNGAVSPFTAGELAKAAFNNGYEEYGWNIIDRFINLVERDGNISFLYYPDGTQQGNGGPSAWGAAAFISAVDEGLAGIQDIGVSYDEMLFSPKFPVAPYSELRYITGYEMNNTVVDVRYIITEEGMRYDIYSPKSKIHSHILMPKACKCKKLFVDGKETEYLTELVGNSMYLNFDMISNGKISVEVIFDKSNV